MLNVLQQGMDLTKNKSPQVKTANLNLFVGILTGPETHYGTVWYLFLSIQLRSIHLKYDYFKKLSISVGGYLGTVSVPQEIKKKWDDKLYLLNLTH